MTAGQPANANVAVLFERAAARRAEAPAIIAADGRAVWTFGDLAEASARLAGGLVERGLGLGDRVLVLERDPRELFRLVVAVIWAGGSVVIPPGALPLRRALQVVAGGRPTLLAASPLLWPAVLADSQLRRAPIKVVSGRWALPGGATVEAMARHQPIGPTAVSAEDPAIMSYTTGSTGRTKAVIRTHGVLRAQHDALGTLRALNESDRDFAGLPMLTLHNLASGVTSVLAPRRPGSAQYGARVRGGLVRGQATTAAGFPYLFDSAVRTAGRARFSGLRSVYVGGSHVRPELIAALRAIAPAAAATVVYGSTEVEPIAAIEANEYVDLLARSEPAEGTCVGAVLDGLDVRLEPPRGAHGSAPPQDAPGRILLRGARAAHPAGTDGWVDTGDAGRIDSDGRLWLLGRSANALGNLYPAEVERLIEALPWVSRAALVGPGPEAPPRSLLAVQPAAWADPRARADQVFQLQDIVRDRHWPLDEVVLLRRLPVTVGPAAKVDYGRLRSSGDRR